MKIALIGAQGVGKTTIINELAKMEKFKDFTIIKEVVRSLNEKFNISINEEGTDESHLLIANEHFKNSIQFNNFITDRSIIDNWVYTKLLWDRGVISDWVFNYIDKLKTLILPKYDIIFYIPPEFDIIGDGVRSTNKEFQKNIDLIFNEFLNNHSNIYKITGTIDERINKIMEKINEKFTRCATK